MAFSVPPNVSVNESTKVVWLIITRWRLRSKNATEVCRKWMALKQLNRLIRTDKLLSVKASVQFQWLPVSYSSFWTQSQRICCSTITSYQCTLEYLPSIAASYRSCGGWVMRQQAQTAVQIGASQRWGGKPGAKSFLATPPTWFQQAQGSSWSIWQNIEW